MRFRLVEETLTEAIQPSYRDMLFSLIGLLTTNQRLKELVCDEEARKSLQFHHIDGEYITKLTGRKVAKNNDPSNIAIVSTAAHQHITKLNRGQPQQKVNNFRDAASNEDYKDFIFPLYDCLPNLAARALESEMRQ